MPYGYASDVVRDGQLVAQVRTWMVCYSCGHEQQEAQECALCGNVDELHPYLSERGRDPASDPRRGSKCEGGVSMRMKDQGEA